MFNNIKFNILAMILLSTCSFFVVLTLASAFVDCVTLVKGSAIIFLFFLSFGI